MVAGVLATGGGLVFTGDAEGSPRLRRQTGEDPLALQCGSGHHASPITYSAGRPAVHRRFRRMGGLDRRFHRRRGCPGGAMRGRGNTLFVFALPKEK